MGRIGQGQATLLGNNCLSTTRSIDVSSTQSDGCVEQSMDFLQHNINRFVDFTNKSVWKSKTFTFDTPQQYDVDSDAKYIRNFIKISERMEKMEGTMSGGGTNLQKYVI